MALSPQLGKVVEFRGVEGLVAAEILTDNNETGEGLTYGPVFSIAGVAEISREVDASLESKYYDNKPMIVVNSVGADTVTCSVSVLELEVLAKLTGQTYVSTLGALVEGQREEKYFAMGYITKNTAGDEMYVWRHKGSFNIPNEQNVTENAGTDSNGQELVFTGISTTHKLAKNDNKGAKALIVNTALELADVDNFFDTPQTIDTIEPIEE